MNDPSPEQTRALSPVGLSPFVLRVSRYGIVGVVVMIFFAGLNWLFGRRFGEDTSFLLAYPPAIALHFWLNKKWTFGCERTDSRRQVSEYLVMVAVTFAMQAIVFKLLTAATHLPGWICSAGASAAQMIVTFLAMQYRIFRKRPGADRSRSTD